MQRTRHQIASTVVHSNVALGGGIFLAAAAVYARTALRGPGLGDTAKLQFVGKVFGIPHATGYPLYILVSHVAGLVPVASLATRENLLSAVCAALAVAFVFGILRTLEVHRVPAAAASLVFAFTPTLWSQAVIAEVYGLQESLMAFTILCWTRWWKIGRPRWAIGALAVEAVMLGNHMMSVTLLPATIWILWRGRRRITAAVVKTAALCTLVPVALYSTLYVWTEVRPAAYLESPVASWYELRYVLTGARFDSVMFAFSLGEVFRTRLPMVWDELWAQFGWLVVVIAIGSVVMVLRDRTVAAFFGLIALADLFVVVNYGIYDIFIYFLPAWTVGAVLLGLGLDALLEPIKGRAVALACAALFLLLPLWPVADNWSKEDLSAGLPSAGKVQEAIAAVPDNAMMISSYADYEIAEVIWYFLLGEGEGARRNISLYSPYGVDDVCRYLRDGVRPDTTWQRYVFRFGEPTPLGERPPAGLRVFALDDEATTLTAAGFTLDPGGAPGLYQVHPPPACGGPIAGR